jgi:hypothetical protein
MTPAPQGFASLSAEAACAALRASGLMLEPADLQLARREERWAIALPGNRMAWFAASAAGQERLAAERRVLRLLARRCTFQVPHVVYEDPAGFDVREIVVGECDPWALYAQIKTDPALARRIGRSLGAILVEQHARVSHVDVAGWLREQVEWPCSKAWIRERIADVIDDPPLIAAIDHLLDRYEGVAVDPDDRVFVHTDLGLHNLAVDPQTKEVRGVFDYDGAAWADRHHDFRYLALSIPHEPVLDAALTIYEPALGRRIDRQRVWLYNAACAASFLAFRHGVPADERWCGRTLAEDLTWLRDALSQAQMSP